MGLDVMKMRYCLIVATLVNLGGLYWFGYVLERPPESRITSTTKVRLASLGMPDVIELQTVPRPPGAEGLGASPVGPADRPGAYGEGGNVTWGEAGPRSEDEAIAPGASPAPPGESGTPAPGFNERPIAGLGGNEENLQPSPHTRADPESQLPPQPAAAGAGEADRRPLGELSPDPIRPSSARAGQEGPGESAPGRGEPPSGDGTGPGAGPGPGGTATPDGQPTLKPGEPGGVGGAGGSSGGRGGSAGGGSVGAEGRGGTGGGEGRGSGTSGTGTGGGGGGGPAAGDPRGGGGGGGETKPRNTTASMISCPGPSLSRELQRMGVHGAVKVRVSVSAGGAVTNAVILNSSGHPEIDRDALRRAKSGRYKAATANGKAVPGSTEITLRY